MGEQRRLFEQLSMLGYRVASLKGIIQNEGAQVTKEQLDAWDLLITSVTEDLIKVKAEILEFHSGEVSP